MRRIAGLLMVLLLLGAAPAAAQSPGDAPPGPAAEAEDTIFGMRYGTAAFAAAGAVAGAVALNAVAPNVGTVALALYAAHWVVQGAVIYGAGSYLGWWDDAPEAAGAAQPVRLLKD